MQRTLSDGTFKVEGASMFGPVSRLAWEQWMQPDRKHRITLELNCLFLETSQGKKILVNTGIGTVIRAEQNFQDTYAPSSSKLIRNLNEIKVTPNNIDIVLLTDLRFPSAGGCMRLNRAGKAVPTFSKAVYIVQKDALMEATRPGILQELWYHDVVSPLAQQDKLFVIEGDQEIDAGIRVIRTDGPSQGHQIVVVEWGADRILYLGSLLPTKHHIDLKCHAIHERFPEQTLAWKQKILHMAERGGYLVIFQHGNACTGYIEKNRDGMYYLREINR